MHAVVALLAGLSCCVAPKQPPPPPTLLHPCQPGRLPGVRDEACVPDGDRQRSRRGVQRQERSGHRRLHRHGRREPRRVEQLVSLRPRRRLRRRHAPGRTRSRSAAPSPRPRRVQGRHRTDVYATPLCERACPSTRSQRDGPSYVPNALRTAPAHLNDANAMTYVTPNVELGTAASRGDLPALGHAHRRLGRLVGRRRLHQGPRDARLHDGAPPARRARASRPRWAPGRPADFTRRGEVRHRLAAAHVGRPDAGRSTTRSASAAGNAQDRRRPRHLAAAAGGRHVRRHRSALPLHPQPARLPAGAARLTDQPEPRRTDAAAFAPRASSSSRRAIRRSPTAALLAAEHIFDLAEHQPGDS